MYILKYRRHFALMAGVLAGLAATREWRPPLGAVASFGVYGALYSALFALSSRTPSPAWRVLLFVGMGACLSMASATLGLWVDHGLRWVPASGRPALLLALASGLGAVGFALLVRRWFDTALTFSVWLTVCAVCILATMMVLAAGLAPAAGGLWTAAAWWLAFSGTLWLFDGRYGHLELLRRKTGGTIRR